MDKTLLEKITRVQLLITDVDGVLTDGSMYYTENGDEFKRFSTLDGGGILLLKLAGIKTFIITSENTDITARRAEKIGVARVYQGVHDKVDCAGKFISEMGLTFRDICYIGDDINDLPLLLKVGFAVTVPRCTAGIDKCSDYMTAAQGGSGAVREVCELILHCQSKYHDALSKYYKRHNIEVNIDDLKQAGFVF